MSRLYFHTQSTTAEVMGWEAHWLHSLPGKIAVGFVPSIHWDSLDRHLLPDSYLRGDNPVDKERALRLEVSTSMRGDQFCDEEGKPLATPGLILNTVLQVGSDPVCLATRVGAQCEIHGFIEEQDRDWAAGLINQGRQQGFLRDGAGWEKVIRLLERTEDHPGPVVCSYSTTDGFPNPDVAGWVAPTNEEGEEDHDAWYELPEAVQWASAVQGIRTSTSGLRISPDTLRYPFTHERSFIDLFVKSPERQGAS